MAFSFSTPPAEQSELGWWAIGIGVPLILVWLCVRPKRNMPDFAPPKRVGSTFRTARSRKSRRFGLNWIGVPFLKRYAMKMITRKD